MRGLGRDPPRNIEADGNGPLTPTSLLSRDALLTTHDACDSIGFVADKMTSDKLPETPAPASGASYTGKQPPPFGHQLLEYFHFDPGYINLNNGSLVLDYDPSG